VLAVRTATAPLGLVDAVRTTVRAMDATLPVAHVQTMEDYVRAARAPMAFTMVLLALAGVTALLLGVVGIYGVIAYVVGRRTAEIGIRMALGARAANVKGMVLRQGGSVALLGVLFGLVGALALTRVMASVLFGVSPTDPATYVAASIGLLVLTLLATYVPARRRCGSGGGVAGGLSSLERCPVD
jgi:ABC-type antimicrobial peptide transport system permease subunit